MSDPTPTSHGWFHDAEDAVLTTAKRWLRHRDDRLSAALAFYSVFSMAPLLVIVVAIAGFVWGRDAVRGEIVSQFGTLIGPGAAQQVETVLRNASNPGTGLLAGSIGLVSLVFGATAVFGQLKAALNTIWNAPPAKKNRWLNLLRNRLLALAMVLGVAFLMLVSLILSAALAAAARWSAGFTESFPFPVLRTVDFGMSFVMLCGLFAMIYKVLPDVRIPWSDVWVGAAITSALFNLGKYLIGLYLGRAGFGSVFGAAGSLAILLVWVYYSTCIFLFGAEFTRVYNLRWGAGTRRA